MVDENTVSAAGSHQRTDLRPVGVMAACILTFFSSVTHAATPTDVFRAVDDVIAKVRLLHDANLSEADAGDQSIQPTDRKPRHVLQLSRTVLDKANGLAMINGGMVVPVPPIPNREVKPDDVLTSIEATDSVITSLLPIFHVEATANRAAPADKKTPNDVYAALYRLSALIDGLGIPATVPNDVYRIAETIISELVDIVEQSGMPMPARAPASTEKSPKDVYNRAFELTDSLQQLLEKRPDLVPDGGFTMPQQHKGKIKPEHVRYVLNDLLAEVASIHVAMGSQEKIVLASIASGRTPSDVYDQLTNAIALVEVMIANV